MSLLCKIGLCRRRWEHIADDGHWAVFLITCDRCDRWNVTSW